MADEWVLVPPKRTPEMWEASQNCIVGYEWDAMLAARPPIPRPVWDAMVERGAKASWDFLADHRGDWNTEVKEETRKIWIHEWELGFRAALNNPRVEGDDNG